MGHDLKKGDSDIIRSFILVHKNQNVINDQKSYFRDFGTHSPQIMWTLGSPTKI